MVGDFPYAFWVCWFSMFWVCPFGYFCLIVVWYAILQLINQGNRIFLWFLGFLWMNSIWEIRFCLLDVVKCDLVIADLLFCPWTSQITSRGWFLVWGPKFDSLDYIELIFVSNPVITSIEGRSRRYLGRIGQEKQGLPGFSIPLHWWYGLPNVVALAIGIRLHYFHLHAFSFVQFSI